MNKTKSTAAKRRARKYTPRQKKMDNRQQKEAYPPQWEEYRRHLNGLPTAS